MESDRDLLARFADPEPDARAAALLLARHWRAVHEYAVICLTASTAAASMAAAAAFQQVLARRTAGGALLPQLLSAVRNMGANGPPRTTSGTCCRNSANPPEGADRAR